MKQVNLRIYRMILPLLMGIFLSLGAYAQQVTVKGHVKDSTGEPVIGANVLVKGTTLGTITDFDGNFTLSAPQNSTIEISFIGYKAVEVKTTPTINVTLLDDSVLLDEAVIIGYGVVKKEDLTGSVTAISANSLAKGMATSAADLLAGKAPGVSIMSDGGAPGAKSTIRIRGGSSLSASNDPLIVIDGVPIDNGDINGMSNPLSTVNPNDIESFSILKDASAAAIYGSRASNGVIIITTKKGSVGKVRVAYDGTFSVSHKAGEIDVMSADTYREAIKSRFAADSKQVLALGTANTNWQDEVFQTAFSTDHNIGVSGAIGTSVPYRVSVGYTDQDGILKTSNMERWTGAVSLNPKFFDNHLSVQLNVKGIHNKNRFANDGAIGAAAEFDPTQPVHSDSKFGNGYYMSLKEDGTPIDIGITNPLAILNEREDRSKVNRSIGNIQFDYRMHFLPDLRVNLNLGYDVSKSSGTVYINDNSPMSYTWGANKAGWGENSEYEQLKRNQLMEFYLNYTKTIDRHKLDVMGGYSWQHFYRSESTVYPYSNAMQEKTGEEFWKGRLSSATESYLISFYGRLNYTFANRYLLTATLRDDGSSRFNKNNRWGLFPSVALAWRISEEPFMQNQSLFSDLKLRLGYGITGQQDINQGDYPYMAIYSYSKAGANYFWGDNMYQLVRPAAYDKELKWEETTTYNVGLDYGFLGNRISGGVDVYFRKTKDLLNTIPVPAGANFSNQLFTNIGSLKNSGIEFNITAHPIESKDMNWNISYNVSYNKNEITKLSTDGGSYVQWGGISGGTGNTVLVHQTGKPYGSFFVYEQVYDANGKPIEGAYVDQNKDGSIDGADLIAYEKSAPDVLMGLSSQFSYKNWDFNFAMRASLGNYAYNNMQSNRESWTSAYDPSGFLKNRLNSASNTNFNAAQFMSSYYVQNASFLKMDNISLGYTFYKPFKWIESARLYGTVQNVFTITDYDGLDPEVSNNGIDNNRYPRPRIYMLGVSLKF